MKNETIAQKIKRLRLELGMTPTDFAAAIGVAYVTLYRWETGSRVPHRVFMKAIEQLAERKGK